MRAGADGEPAVGPKSGYYTKPQETIQSPDRVHKGPKHYTKPRHTIQRYRILDKTQKY